MSYFISFFTTFVLTSSWCFYIDVEKTYQRIQRKQRHEIINDYKKMLPDVIKNIIVTYIVMTFVEDYLNNLQRNNTLFDFVIIICSADFLFYFFHRIAHFPSFYFLHKKHHEFSYTYGIGSIYSSIPEQVFVNLCPGMIPVLLLHSGDMVNKFIIVFSTFYTVYVSHSGHKKYKDGHIVHHLSKTKIFGLLISDRVFNTAT